MRLYDFADSGNGYKVRLLLAQLGRPYELVPVDILHGGSRTPEFLKKNPNGKLAARRDGGLAALRVLDEALAGRAFLVADRYSIADIALYAYTHVAPEGGFPLEPYPAIRAWMERVRAQPGHVPQ